MAQDKLPSAQEVAKYLIELASKDPDYKFKGLTNLQLQKLLYYAQGWSLGRRDQPIFRDGIRAWKFGPVVKDVYHQYKNYDDKCIPAEGVTAELPPLTAAFVAAMWDDYKWYSPSDLVEKTHHEQPWLEARGDLKAHEPSDEPMPHNQMRDFFSQPSVDQLTPEQLHAIVSHGMAVSYRSSFASRIISTAKFTSVIFSW